MDHLRPIHRFRSLCLLFSLFTACDVTSSSLLGAAATTAAATVAKLPRSLAVKHLGIYSTYPNTHSYYYLDSPISLPPYEDVMGPSSSPEEDSPTCLYPPLTPLTPLPPSPNVPIPIQSPPPPSTSTSPPIIIPNPPTFSTPTAPPAYFPSPPPPIIIPNPPTFSTPTAPPAYFPSPPEYYEPTPPIYTSPPIFIPGPPMSPPEYFKPTPPIYTSPPIFIPGPPMSPPEYYEPTPPIYTSPPIFVPGPPMFEPPVVYPPPTVLAPPYIGTGPGMWCVAKPTVPDPIIEEAMDYACGSGADCNSIQPNGKCFQPNTMIAHASFAFNSYWQRTRVNGGTCDFGGTAMLVTKDPSYDGCHFSLY